MMREVLKYTLNEFGINCVTFEIEAKKNKNQVKKMLCNQGTYNL